MLANPYKIVHRVGNTLTIRYSREIVRQHHRTHGDSWPFLPDMRVGMIVEHVENRPAIVVQRLLSGGGYNITLEWLPAPQIEGTYAPEWLPAPEIEGTYAPEWLPAPEIEGTYAAAGGASEF